MKGVSSEKKKEAKTIHPLGMLMEKGSFFPTMLIGGENEFILINNELGNQLEESLIFLIIFPVLNEVILFYHIGSWKHKK